MTTAIAPAKKTSLYELAIESQEVDGALAIAFDKAASEDPEEQAEAERIIADLLHLANTTQAALAEKANAICHVHEAMAGRAEFLRKSTAERIARAEAEERAAERLLSYLSRTMSALHPGQKSFKLPEYTLASRSSEAVALDEDARDQLPERLRRWELNVKLASNERADEVIDQLLAEATELLRDRYCLDPSDYDVAVKDTPDKTAIKAAIKAGNPVPGASIERRTKWSIK